MSDIDVAFCRSMLAQLAPELKAIDPKLSVWRGPEWVWKTGRQDWEFHGPAEFYWHGRAANAYDARYKGWSAWMEYKRKHGAVAKIIERYPNFRVEDTGGGCEAYSHPVDDGGWIWITAVDDPSLPEIDAKVVSIGRYVKKPIAFSDEGCAEFIRFCPVKDLERTIDGMMARAARKRRGKRKERA